MKKSYRKVTAALLLFFITSTSNTIKAFAEPNELTLEQALQNIQECDNKIEYNMDKLNTLKEQVLNKEKDIKDNENQLNLAEKEVEEKNNQLSERLKVIQQNGGLEITSLQYIDAIFSSGDVLDALKRVSLISKICTSDKSLISEAKDSEAKILSIKENIVKEKDELQKNEDDVQKQINDLEDEKNNLTKYVEENNALLIGDTGITIPVTLPSDITDQAKGVIEEAQKYLKIPYVWGGESPEGFDCSGLMQYVFKAEGIDIPRTSEEQQSFAKQINIAEIKPGDLVFNAESEATHVGMYIGYDMYIQAPHTGDVVKISKLSSSNMKYAGRILN